jgi:hypothetical protein
MPPAHITSPRHTTGAQPSPFEGTEDSANWERTRRARERLPAIPLSDGIFKGRPIIHRDSRIDGCVCVGASGQGFYPDFAKWERMLSLDTSFPHNWPYHKYHLS